MKKVCSFFAAIGLLASCTGESVRNGENEISEAQNANLKGYAQKGQFVKGSQVTAFAVGADLVPTGESFPANISDDLGAFALQCKTDAPYLELRAEGYYLNELTGSVSESPLYLESFAQSGDNAVNINLLTTAIRPRVKKLIGEGKPYESAVSQAQGELLSALGFAESGGSFDDLDITGTTDADGMLLAFSLMVQNGSASKVTTLIQAIASELEADGTLSSDSVRSVWEDSDKIDPYDIIERLSAYYSGKNLPVETVPPFWKFLGEEYDRDFFMQTYSDVSAPGIITPASAIDGEYHVLSVIDFSVEADREGVSFEKRHIFGPAWVVAYNIPANTADEPVSTAMTFKDAEGNVLYTESHLQGADVQYLMISGGSATKALQECYFAPGCELSVNGRTVSVEEIVLPGMEGFSGVKVPKVSRYAVCYPAGIVFPAEHIARVAVNLPAEAGMSAQICYYGAVAPTEDFAIVNPARVTMQPCTAAFAFSVGEDYADSWAYAEIEPNSPDEYLAGTASFVVNEQDAFYFSDLDTEIRYGEPCYHSLRINNDGTDGRAYCLTFPQTLQQGLTIRLYGKSGEALLSRSYNRPLSLRAGQLLNLGTLE